MSVTSSLATRPLSEHPTCATIAAATALRHTMGRDAQIGGTQSNNASRVAGMYHTRDGRRITVVIEIVASGNEYVYSLTALYRLSKLIWRALEVRARTGHHERPDRDDS